MAGQLFDCHTYLVFGPVLVGLQKPSPCGVNLTGFNLLFVHCTGVSHSVKIGLWTYPLFWAYPYVPVHFVSCIARLWLVHSCNILHTKLIECIIECIESLLSDIFLSSKT